MHLANHLVCVQLNREASLVLLVCNQNVPKCFVFRKLLDFPQREKKRLETISTHLRSGRGRFNPDSGSVGDNGESGVTAESRNRRIVTESGQRRRNATASAWLISDILTPFTCYRVFPSVCLSSVRFRILVNKEKNRPKRLR